MAGYSATPLFRKLGIKEGTSLVLLDAPPGVIDDLPPGVRVRRALRGRADVVVAFFIERGRLGTTD